MLKVAKNTNGILTFSDTELKKEAGENKIDKVIIKQAEGEVVVFDNGGKTQDRYTIIFPDGTVVGADENPFHPQGFWQHVDEVDPESYIASAMGEDQFLGKQVEVSELPEDVQKAINQELEPDVQANLKKKAEQDIRNELELEVSSWELKEFTNATIDEIIDDILYNMENYGESIDEAKEHTNQKIVDGELPGGESSRIGSHKNKLKKKAEGEPVLPISKVQEVNQQITLKEGLNAYPVDNADYPLLIPTGTNITLNRIEISPIEGKLYFIDVPDTHDDINDVDIPAGEYFVDEEEWNEIMQEVQAKLNKKAGGNKMDKVIMKKKAEEGSGEMDAIKDIAGEIDEEYLDILDIVFGGDHEAFLEELISGVPTDDLKFQFKEIKRLYDYEGTKQQMESGE